MLKLYGKKYAKTEREFTDSLFCADGTCNGFYKITPEGVYFSDMQNRERVFIRKDGFGPVTVGKFEGKRRYMHACSSLDESWINRPESYTAMIEGAALTASCAFGAQFPTITTP